MNNLAPLNSKETQCLLYYYTKKCTKVEAYKSAYNCENMTDNACYVEASRFFSDPKITLWMQQYQRNVQKTIQDELDYDAKKHFDELNELKGIALNSFDKNGNPNVNAAIKTTELKGKLVGLYNQDKNEEVSNNNFNVIGTITLDNKKLEFNVGEVVENENSASGNS